MLEQIQRDVNRTHAEHPFFEGQAASSVAHRAALTRALQVFAKLNPGLLYVQVSESCYATRKPSSRHGQGSAASTPCMCDDGEPRRFGSVQSCANTLRLNEAHQLTRTLGQRCAHDCRLLSTRLGRGPTVGLQGMNELYAPLFFVFANDPDEAQAVRLSTLTCSRHLLCVHLSARRLARVPSKHVATVAPHRRTRLHPAPPVPAPCPGHVPHRRERRGPELDQHLGAANAPRMEQSWEPQRKTHWAPATVTCSGQQRDDCLGLSVGA